MAAQQPQRRSRSSRPGSARRLAGLLVAGAAALGCFQAELQEGLLAFLLGPRSCGSRAASRGSPQLRRPPQSARLAEGQEGDWSQRIRVENLQPGQELNGIVNSVAPFGCFVDVGAERDGLVHISRIADGYVESVANLVQPGQSVKVWVVGVSPDGRLGLTMVKKETPSGAAPDLSGLASIPSDRWLDGVVRTVTDFGAFVSVELPGGGPPAQGLVHISQMKDSFVEHPSMEVKVGQAVKVRILEADMQRGKLKLSMKEVSSTGAQTRPDAQEVAAFQTLQPSQWIQGRVHHTTSFGVFVEVQPPGGGSTVQGMVHITEIRDGFVDDPASEVQVGQEVKVRVVSIDEARGKVSLSMKEEKAPE